MLTNNNIFNATEKRLLSTLNRIRSCSRGTGLNPHQQEQKERSLSQKIKKEHGGKRSTSLTFNKENQDGQKSQLRGGMGCCDPLRLTGQTQSQNGETSSTQNSRKFNTPRTLTKELGHSQVDLATTYGHITTLGDTKTAKLQNQIHQMFYIFNFLILSFNLKILNLKILKKSEKNSKNFTQKKIPGNKIQTTLMILTLLLAAQRTKSTLTLLNPIRTREIDPPTTLKGYDATETVFVKSSVKSVEIPRSKGAMYLYFTQAARGELNQVFIMNYLSLKASGSSSKAGVHVVTGTLISNNIQIFNIEFIDHLRVVPTVANVIVHYKDNSGNGVEEIKYANLRWDGSNYILNPIGNILYTSNLAGDEIGDAMDGVDAITVNRCVRWDSFLYIKSRNLLINSQATSSSTHKYDYKIRAKFLNDNKEVFSDEITMPNDYGHVSFIKLNTDAFGGKFAVLDMSQDTNALSIWDYTDGLAGALGGVNFSQIKKTGTTGHRQYVTHFPPKYGSQYIAISSHLGDVAGGFSAHNLAFFDYKMDSLTTRLYEFPGLTFPGDLHTHVISLFLCSGTTIYLNVITGNGGSGTNPHTKTILIDNGSAAITHLEITKDSYDGFSFESSITYGKRILPMESSNTGGFLLHGRLSGAVSKLYYFQVLDKTCHPTCGGSCKEDFLGMNREDCNSCASGFTKVTGSCLCSITGEKEIFNSGTCGTCGADKTVLIDKNVVLSTSSGDLDVEVCMTPEECRATVSNEGINFVPKGAECISATECLTTSNYCYVPSTQTCSLQSGATGGELIFYQSDSKNYCLVLSECSSIFGKFNDGSTCTDSCGASAPYGDSFDGSCYTAQGCRDASSGEDILVPFEKNNGDTVEKFCDLKSNCLSSEGFLLFDSDTICKDSTNCSEKRVEATNQCVTTCPDLYPLIFNNMYDYCIDATKCAADSNFVYGSTCITRSQCVSGSSTKFNKDDNICIASSDTVCIYRTVDDQLGECRKACPSSHTLLATDNVCHNSYSCSVSELFALSSTNKCLSETECRATTTATPFNIPFVADMTCIAETACTGTKVILIAINGNPNFCLNDCTSDYSGSFNGSKCYTSGGCSIDGGYPVGAISPSTQKLCLNEATCKSTTGYFWNPDTPTCTTEANCQAGYFVIPSTSTCESTCSGSTLYKSNDEKKCLTESECNALTGATYIKAVDDSSNQWCLNENECKSRTGTLYKDGGTCIAESTCDLTFPLPSIGICTSTCPLSVTISGDIKCYTSAECRTAGLTPTTTEAGGNCFTDDECKNPSGKNGLIDYAANGDKTCIDSGTCSRDFTVNSECRDTCPYYLEADGGPGFCAYDETECRTTHSGFPLDYGDGGQKYCVTETQCKDGHDSDKPTWFDQVGTDSKSQCVTTAQCTKTYKVDGEGLCTDTCDFLFNKSEDECKNEAACTGLGTLPVQGKINSKDYCYTEDECKTDPATLLIIGNPKICELAEECFTERNMIREPSTGLCISSCSNYITYESDFCLTEAECLADTSRGKTTTIQDGTKQCLSPDQCRDTNTVVYDVNDEICILETSCEPTKFLQRASAGIKECNSSCPLYLAFIDTSSLSEGDTPERCVDETLCDAKTELTMGDSLKVTDADGQKYCVDETSCKFFSKFIYDTENTSCIQATECGSRYTVEDARECMTVCTYYLNDDASKCLTESECDALEEHYKVTDADSQKHCLTKEQCEKKSGFVFDIDNDSCILTTTCTLPRFHVVEEGRCKNECDLYLDQTEDFCYTINECNIQQKKLLFVPDIATEQKRCYSDKECRDAKEFVQDSTQPVCVTKTQCKAAKRYTIEPEQDCFEKCTTAKTFHQDQECYTRCPKDGEFGQRVTYLCVPEASCDDVTLPDGKVADGVGNTDTGFCVAKLEVKVDADPTNLNENYTTEEGTTELIPKENPRETSLEGSTTTGDVVAVQVPISIPVPPVQKTSTITLVSSRKRRRRILQGTAADEETPIPEYEVFTPADQPEKTYVIFKNPSDEEFITKLTFNTKDEFTTTGKDGSEVKFKIGIPFSEILIPAVPIKAEEPTGLIGILTGIYDIYLRVISPFITLINPSLAFQSVLAQNYQHMTLYSILDFWKLSSNDWLYVKTIKDWLAEGGLLIVNSGDKETEKKEECSNGRERNCFFEKNLSLLTGGVGALIVLAVYLIIGIIGNIIKNEKLKYLVFPSSILGLETNILFYSLYSLLHFYNNVASPIFGLIALVIFLIIFIQALIKGSSINLYCSEIYKKTFKFAFSNKIRALLVLGIIYEIALSALISALVNIPILQTLLFIGLEGLYFSFVFTQKPFKDTMVQLFILAQRGVCLFNGFLMLIISIIDKDNGFTKFLHMLIFISTIISILGGIILIILKILKKEKSDITNDNKKMRGERGEIYKEASKEEFTSKGKEKEKIDGEGSIKQA